uniref:HTH OST-type domain-containing protein n=1 Tax=Anopheles christyi TaxID=43041 RepID=A0A182JWN1_9DIPT
MRELKAILRSLVISNTERGMSASQLDRDFKSIEGRSIPFRDHGFQSLDAMLRTMTDVVKVMGNGTSATIYPVISEKNQHILALVEKSKKNKRKKSNYIPSYVRKTSANPLSKPKGNYFNENNYNCNNNNNDSNKNPNGNGRATNGGQNISAPQPSNRREHLTITIPNDTNEQFNMFWTAIQPMLNTHHNQNNQQAWINQYGYNNAQHFQNNRNGNQQCYSNNKNVRTGQRTKSNSRASAPHCMNNNDFSSGYRVGYYSHYHGNGYFNGNSYTGAGYPNQQNFPINYYSGYGYSNFQTNVYNNGWEFIIDLRFRIHTSAFETVKC